MTREIKFRAWDDIRKKMITEGFAIRCEDDIYSGEFLDGINNDLWQRPSDFSRIENTHLMQFTGLKDKNGKEIYEGDMVKDHEWSERGNREVRYGEAPVDASDYEPYEVAIIGFYLTNYLGRDENEALNSLKAQDLEVIGNVHENKDLLQ
jgi:uncharacterized phage protein (TIGR01671 family)